MRIRPTRTDVFGKLAVAHRQNAEQKASVELVRAGRDLFAQGGDAAQQRQQGALVTHVSPQRLKFGQQRQPLLVGVVALQLVGQSVVAGEGRGENDARLVAQRLGQQPALRQKRAFAGLLKGLHQRNPGLAQRIKPRRHRQLRRHIQRLNQLRGHAILGAQVEAAGAGGQANDLVAIVNRLKAPGAIFAFHHAGDVLRYHQAAEALGDKVNQPVAAQDALDIIGGHHRLLGTRQTQARAANHH